MRISRARSSLTVTIAVVISVSFASTGSAIAPAGGSITGVVFEDGDRDGSLDPDEQPMAGHLLYLFDAVGAYVGKATSATDGSFAFGVVPGGSYTLSYASQSWWDIRADFVPTSTGSLKPVRALSVDGDVVAHFGWRRLERSTDPAAPLDEYRGPEGLRVRTYIDALRARDVYDAAMRGTVGPEASTVLIMFGLAAKSSATLSVVSSGGSYSSYAATVHLDYISWLDSGDRNLAHEYGHAWSMYHAYLTHQDDTLATYLEARGIAGDERVGSTYLWSPRELIAEDYRQLLGSETARVAPQANRELAAAASVPGLEAFLRDVFTAPLATEVEPAPSPEPTPEPSPSPSPEPTTRARGKKDGSAHGGGGGGKKR